MSAPGFLGIALAVPIICCVSLHSAAAEKKAEQPAKSVGIVDFSTENASMHLNLLIQAGLHIFPNQAPGKRNTFALERARLGVSGHLISKNFTYVFVGDGAASLQRLHPTAPGSEVAALPGAPSVPFVLDAFVRLHIPAARLLFTVGRFVPSFGVMMAEDPGKLGAALYPLYLLGGTGALGSFRDVGLETEIKLGKAVALGGGVYNGGFNNWLDDNDRKDLSVFLTIRKKDAFVLRASSLFKFRNVENGFDQMQRPIENEEETHITPSIEARYADRGFDVIGGYAMDLTFRNDKDTRDDDRSQGAFGHFGYLLFGDLLELAAQFDWWDPSVYVHNNQQYRLTIGPAVHLESVRLTVRVSYIQDIFMNAAAMCESYLFREDCADADTIPEADRLASTLFFQLTLAL